MKWWLAGIAAVLGSCGGAQPTQPSGEAAQARVRLGAEIVLEERPELVQKKRIAVVAHAASRLPDSTHTVDALLQAGAEIVRIFAPEHGFRGEAEAGAPIQNSRDPATGLPIASLYGANKKPSLQQLAGLDAVVFDIQDVGVRTYTYLTTLHYVMQACAEAGVKLIVLDRPNPNGFYTGGPLLQPGYESFVGVRAGLPLVHGLTLGEYAALANTQGWLDTPKPCRLEVIWCENYTHAQTWPQTGLPWFAPSPNLQSPWAAVWYPALVLFEGTVASAGRGTAAPFTRAGMPQHTAMLYRWKKDSLDGQPPQAYTVHGHRLIPDRFVPRAQPGKAARPKFAGEVCWGVRLPEPETWTNVDGAGVLKVGIHLLKNFLNEYDEYFRRKRTPPVQGFFNDFFDALAGNAQLRAALLANEPEASIWESIEKELTDYRRLRTRHLHYPSQ